MEPLKKATFIGRTRGRTKPAGTRWTIHDIAREAGVSAKTVSRVVNHEPRVAEATRARVQRIIDEVGYYPHTGARSLRGRPPDSIGLTVSAPIADVPLSQELLSWLFAELYRIFGVNGNIISFDPNPFVSGNSDYARGLWEKRFGAIFIAGPLKDDDPVIRRVHDSGRPYLTVSRVDSLPDCSSAAVDFNEAAYVSTRFLIERGHRRIAMLTRFDGYTAGKQRRDGYLRALAEAGIQPDADLVRGVAFGPKDIENAVHRLLLDTQTTALVDASVAEDASGLRDGARRADRIPGDNIDIVCWTYTYKAVVLSDACAHVWIPLREAASEGLELLEKWLSGQRDGPINVLYRPILYETTSSKEIPQPKPLFSY